MLKDKKEKELEAKRNEEQEATFNRDILKNKNLTQGAPGASSSNWYFNNPQTISLGVSEFNVKWGKRKLEDDWRRKKKNVALAGETDNSNENKSD